MADNNSWAWVSTTLWPGFDSDNQDNLGTNGNGLAVDPNGYQNIIWVDGDNDGLITDADTDDASPSTVDGVKIGGQVKTVNDPDGGWFDHDGDNAGLAVHRRDLDGADQ